MSNATATATAIAQQLVDAGLSESECEPKAALFTRALEALAAVGHNATDVHCWWVPGRIEFLGKHTDYAGGRSLLCAAERGFAVAAVARADRLLFVVDACTGEQASGELRADASAPTGHWSNYPFTVARRIARDFAGGLRGIDLAFASDLPPAAGLSSSSALVVGTFLALSDANGLAERAQYRESITSDEDLAGYLGAVENGLSFGALPSDRGVGTAGGSEDHTAILCSRQERLVQYSFAPVRHERVIQFPTEHALVVMSSGVLAEKTGSALAQYNSAAGRAAAALQEWRSVTGRAAPTLAAALDESPDGYDRMRTVLRDCGDAGYSAESLLDRVEQFSAESREIIPAAADALDARDLAQLGALIDRSQRNAERLLGNQIPETIALARSARELGALAASAFGAGFGGSVYALVPTADAERFRAAWMERYVAEFPERSGASTCFVTRAGIPAIRVG